MLQYIMLYYNIHRHIHTYIYIYIDMYVCTYIYIHIYTYHLLYSIYTEYIYIYIYIKIVRTPGRGTRLQPPLLLQSFVPVSLQYIAMSHSTMAPQTVLYTLIHDA